MEQQSKKNKYLKSPFKSYIFIYLYIFVFVCVYIFMYICLYSLLLGRGCHQFGAGNSCFHLTEPTEERNWSRSVGCVDKQRKWCTHSVWTNIPLENRDVKVAAKARKDGMSSHSCDKAANGHNTMFGDIMYKSALFCFCFVFLHILKTVDKKNKQNPNQPTNHENHPLYIR